ncbi:heavy metal translocating P-type ATPase [Jeongeupia chitinilytica]|uniref:P-type Zn(2+) transporter n=1 Tax=Jeongeupia chitinilytica TaxID=1041641 RepID=A0ABQ3GZF4_9NEIS|nr:heavy metal translocating P-type ATPase [Jeongeupia chitinilytica]GHD62856.1 cation transporter [Jeongeupia chitinilytica]
MLEPTRFVNLGLLLFSALALLAGAVVYFVGDAGRAAWIWRLGALPVLAVTLLASVEALRRRESRVDVLALLAIGGALLLGENLTAAAIALMLASGRALEEYAQARAQREMAALLAHAPRQANRYEGDQVVQIGLEAICRGDRLLVRAGETIPVDGSLLGPAELDEAALTGEALPVSRQSGETALSGTVNAGAAFDMVATTAAADSTFAGVVRLVETARQRRSSAERLADRYALWFVPLTVAIAGTAWLLSGDPLRMLAVLVVATPCPLILAVPVAIVSGMSSCARRGVLVKDGRALEQLAQAHTLFFDKTGTLTSGRARLVAIESDPAFGPDEVLRLAASLDQACKHVLAEAVVSAARERGLCLSLPTRVEEAAGAGVRGIVQGQAIVVGNFPFVSETAPTLPAWVPAFLRRLGFDGVTGVFVSVEGRICGGLQFADEIRPDTPRALRLLRKAGVTRITMLTGDHREVAETFGAVLGVDALCAEQKPADKLAAIEATRAAGRIVIMVGDGVNDAPALQAADVGVAMGARGVAAASEAADVVLLVDRLDRLADALLIAIRARRIAVQSVSVGMGLSGVAMLFAAFGFLPPLIGAVLQEAIDVAVILNALRARSKGSPHPHGTLSVTEVEHLKAEHAELGPVLDRVGWLADRLADLSGPAAVKELNELDTLLRERLLPHERQDDAELYPGIARLLGGDDPMSTLSGMHREIFRLARMLTNLTDALPAEGPDEPTLKLLQGLLYSMNAIIRLHFAQEEELYFALGESM